MVRFRVLLVRRNDEKLYKVLNTSRRTKCFHNIEKNMFEIEYNTRIGIRHSQRKRTLRLSSASKSQCLENNSIKSGPGVTPSGSLQITDPTHAGFQLCMNLTSLLRVDEIPAKDQLLSSSGDSQL